MKHIIAIMAALLLLPPSAGAQTWTPAEQELVEFTRTCWRLFAAKDFAAHEARCLHPDYARWWTGYLTPVDLDQDHRLVREYFSRNSWLTWGVQPLRIDVVGVTAVVRYQLTTYRISDDGTESHQVIGRSDVLVQTEDGWRILAVHEHDVD